MRIGLDYDGVIAEAMDVPPGLRRKDVYAQIPLVEGARAALKSLRDHEVFVITSRSFDRADAQIVEQTGFSVAFDRIFTGVGSADKVALARILRLDYYFDDREDIIETFPVIGYPIGVLVGKRTAGFLYTWVLSIHEIPNFVATFGPSTES